MWIIDKARGSRAKGMDDHESTTQRDHQSLQEIFISVTGETVITDRQDRERHKKVIGLTEGNSPPGDRRFNADSTANRLEDVSSDPELE